MSAKRWDPEGGRAAVLSVLERTRNITLAAHELGVVRNTLLSWALREGVDLSPYRSRGGWESHDKNSEELTCDAQVYRDMHIDRLREERDRYKRLYEHAVSELRSREDICTALAEQFASPLPPPKLKGPSQRSSGHELPEREIVLQVSDWQMGQLVRPEDVGGINEYSWEVFERRLSRWLDAVVSSIRNQRRAYNVTRGVIAMLGDMVEGHDIYSGQAWNLDRDAAMQALDGSLAWAAAVRRLIELTNGITWNLYCVPGNHGKPGGRRAGAMPSTFSFDYLFYRLLERELSQCGLAEIAIEPAGRLLFWSAGHVFLCIHGDEVKAWSGFPAYGLDKADARLAKELDRAFAYLLLGHWHQTAMLPSGRGARIINGSAVGATQLTQTAVLGATLPTQNMLWLSKDYGLAEVGIVHLAPEKREKPVVYGSPGNRRRGSRK